MDKTLWTTSRLLSTAARLNQNQQNQRLLDLEVTQTGATTLKALSESGPISQSGLAAIVQVQAQTMGKILEKLEIRGFVSRDRDSSDGRTIRTVITKQGDKVLQRIDQLSESTSESASLIDQSLRTALIAVLGSLEATPEPTPA
ncbi:MarR family winged helix-turn-helix transcriptional regulator [Arthrobacter sp. CAN_C5]|uniref:MarR family winged helix-turn-helix transcriptional regulator n=1 Tax=Arthrobacter sp. CAN_C5 TaxID=2760706 RepID=UPI001AE74B2A|nr:MarR family transcriptional regulator [Arthrobacter sp. CAN_C5]MBP2216439.1 DNA-binding MarR family transcriptional regulator [Arthrobacter sp. CAN_C5]